jgi:hypothetical protein
MTVRLLAVIALSVATAVTGLQFAVWAIGETIESHSR